MTSFQLWTEQQVLFAIARGPWNARTALDYAQAFKEAAKPLLTKPWAHIVYLDDWELGGPDIEPVIRGLVSWCIEHELHLAAHIYSPNMVKKYQLDRMIIDHSHQFEKRVFPNEADAFAWLASRGFTTDSDSFAKKIA